MSGEGCFSRLFCVYLQPMRSLNQIRDEFLGQKMSSNGI